MTNILVFDLDCNISEELILRSAGNSTEVIELTNAEMQDIMGGFRLPRFPQEIPRPKLPPSEFPPKLWV